MFSNPSSVYPVGTFTVRAALSCPARYLFSLTEEADSLTLGRDEETTTLRVPPESSVSPFDRIPLTE